VSRSGLGAAAGAGGPDSRVDAEDVAAGRPDTSLLLTAEPGDVGELLGGVGEIDIPAISEGRVVVIVFDRVLQPSAALIETADLIRAALELDGPSP